jgi:N-acetylneuraminic acid mutarotase
MQNFRISSKVKLIRIAVNLTSKVMLILIMNLIIFLQLLTTGVSATHADTFWTNGAEMPTNRSSTSGVALDGKIYIIGGGDVLNSKFPIIGNLGMTDIVEVYYPEMNKWNTTAALPQPLDHVASAAYNDKLYAVGGFDRDRNPTDKIYIYDPHDDEWKEGSNMPTARSASAAEFIDGILYVIGGMKGREGAENEEPLRTNEAYNPETNTWIKKSPMPTPRHHLESAVVDGKLFAIGGRMSGLKSNVNVNEMYDPKEDAWTKLEPMFLRNSGFAAASVGDRIYVFGGDSPLETSYRNTAEYDPNVDKWTSGISLPTARMGLQAVSIDDKIYVIGGKTGARTNASGVNEIFNIKP